MPTPNLHQLLLLGLAVLACACSETTHCTSGPKYGTQCSPEEYDEAQQQPDETSSSWRDPTQLDVEDPGKR